MGVGSEVHLGVERDGRGELDRHDPVVCPGTEGWVDTPNIKVGLEMHLEVESDGLGARDGLDP